MTALERVKRAAKKREQSERAWRDAILAAHAEGASLRSIGGAAGVSHVRVLKIIRGE